MISQLDKVQICRDKRLTWEFFRKCGVQAPETFDDITKYHLGFPCFIKPKDGSSSINAYKVDNLDELRSLSERIHDYIIQPYIDGSEFTVDILCDFEGHPIYITPRNRTAVRSGEVSKTVINLDEKIINECKSIVKKFAPCGPITIQLIRNKADKQDYFIEINPRFGGGSPLSIKAGADSPSAILELLLGKFRTSVKTNPVENGAFFSRFDQSIWIPSIHDKKVQAVIFDLDDTLYSEYDYVLQGYKAIANHFSYVDGLEDALKAGFDKGGPAIDYAISQLKKEYPLLLKKEMLSIYRQHSCQGLTLFPEVENLLQILKQNGIKLGIITDGRPNSQYAKIDALGLRQWIEEIIVTDELAGKGNVNLFRKPNKISYMIMKDRFNIPYENMLYVGDNAGKDFIAPQILGMQFLLFNNQDGIYHCTSFPNYIKYVNDIHELKSRLLELI